MHLREGPDYGQPLINRERDTEKKREENKAQQLAGFEPTTSLSRGVCSTTVLQPLPHLSLLIPFEPPSHCLGINETNEWKLVSFAKARDEFQLIVSSL